MVMVAMVDSQVQLGHILLMLVLLPVTNSRTKNGVVLTAFSLVSITLSGKSPLVEPLSLPLNVSLSAQKAIMLLTLVIRLKLKILSQSLTMLKKFSLKSSPTDQLRYKLYFTRGFFYCLRRFSNLQNRSLSTHDRGGTWWSCYQDPWVGC